MSENISLIKDSDAHYPQDTGKGYSLFMPEKCTFEEMMKAPAKKNGRIVFPG